MSGGIKVIQHKKSSISYRDYNSSPSSSQQRLDLPLRWAMPADGEEVVNPTAETPVFPALTYLFNTN
jgi:hypothetical protein